MVLNSLIILLLVPTVFSPAFGLDVEEEKQDELSSRLPGNVIPSHYDLSLIVHLDPVNTFEGFFSMEAVATVGNQYDGMLIMHNNGLVIHEDSLKIEQDAGPGVSLDLEIVGVTHEPGKQYFIIHHQVPDVDETFHFTVSGSFGGKINIDGSSTHSHGFYNDSYVDLESGETIPLAATHFETIGARKAFPCLDEPEYKATFTLKIGRPEGFSSLFNSPPISTGEPIADRPGYFWDTYESTVVMSTYLVAFTVMDFSKVTSDLLPNGVEQATWARKDCIDAGYAEYTKVIGPELIAFYEQTFGIPYAMPKMDQIAYPSKGGAMENYGLITYEEAGLLIDETQTGAQQKRRVITLQAHENAHQWFGNLVTCKWWDELWLNEGFATFLSYLGTENGAPEMDNWVRFYEERFNVALMADDSTDSHPTISPVDNPQKTDFGPHVYERGASMIRMMGSILTYETLFSGLRSYLDRHKFDNTVSDDLWAELNDAGHNSGNLDPMYDVKEIMDLFMRQMNYPLLTVDRDYHRGTARLTQSRFLTDPENADPNDNFSWFVPITFALVGNGQTDFENTVHSETFLEPNSIMEIDIGQNRLPVIFNVQSLGFYRVDYDAENWNMIQSQLQIDPQEIHVLNRAQVIGDSFALAEAGIKPYDLPLSLVRYIRAERDYTPFRIAIDALASLRDRASAPRELEDFVVSIVSERYVSIGGIRENPDNTFVDDIIQQVTAEYANSYRLPRFIADAVSQFQQWMANPSVNTVNRQVRESVYCTAVREGIPGASDFLREILETTALPQEINAITSALFCVRGRETVKSLLEELFSGNFKHAAPTDIVKALLKTREGLDVAWQWLNERSELIEKRIFNMVLERVMEAYGKWKHTQGDLKILSDFIDKHNLDGSSRIQVANALRKVKRNLTWNKRHLNAVNRWLEAHRDW